YVFLNINILRRNNMNLIYPIIPIIIIVFTLFALKKSYESENGFGKIDYVVIIFDIILIISLIRYFI
ncbi:MAG: hypothetical protein IKV87_01560, partial [Methanobrevibacter sp.]|nr:hypothetical protein [Methanobrevibacter sp.]